MPKLAANVSMLFKDLPFLERFAAARRAGFRAVEYQYPYEFKADEVAAAVREAGVQVVLHNMPPGDAARGEHGTASLPGREQRFRDDLERAIAYAGAAGCTRVHCLAGVAGGDEAHRTYLVNLRYAAQRLRREGMLQYDVFHMQLMEGNLAATLERLLPRIGHIQLADAPGRNQPGTGEINFEFLLAHIDRIGYSGWVGCEYNPSGDTLESLKWAQRYLS
jgi:hydroxypyruvate isomerase